MKMVAAAKLRKAQGRMKSTRPYANKMREIVARLVSINTSHHKLLRKPEEVNRVIMIVVGSDKGLCGGFNNNLFKVVEGTLQNEYSEFIKQGKLDLITIGKKAGAYFSKRGYSIIERHPGFFDNLQYDHAAEIMQNVISEFTAENYDKVLISYNEFKTVIAQNRIVEQVLPINPEKLLTEENPEFEATGEYIYEPDPDSILEKLLPVYLIMQLWRAVLDSNAAEQGARMAAMDNATENAKELLQELKLKYNQARQSAITTEISEIVSGAQALKDT